MSAPNSWKWKAYNAAHHDLVFVDYMHNLVVRLSHGGNLEIPSLWRLLYHTMRHPVAMLKFWWRVYERT